MDSTIEDIVSSIELFDTDKKVHHIEESVKKQSVKDKLSTGL